MGSGPAKGPDGQCVDHRWLGQDTKCSEIDPWLILAQIDDIEMVVAELTQILLDLSTQLLR